MKISAPGIYRDFDTSAYFADCCPEPSFTQSLAKILIEQSPLHAYQAHPRLNVQAADEDASEAYNKAQAIGNAAHALMLDRGKEIAVSDFDNWMKADAKKEKAAALAAGKTPILRKHFEIAGRMVDRALEQLSQIEDAENAFNASGDSEVVVANCENGIWLRSMIDWLSVDLQQVWDFKTISGSASPYVLGKKMATDGWHIQAAMHERILNAVDPKDAGRRKFFYVAQEQEEPYSLTVCQIGEAALTIGRKQLDYAIGLWSACMRAGAWPEYPRRIIIPQLPGWAEQGWLNRELAEDDEPMFVPARPKFDPKIIMSG